MKAGRYVLTLLVVGVLLTSMCGGAKRGRGTGMGMGMPGMGFGPGMGMGGGGNEDVWVECPVRITQSLFEDPAQAVRTIEAMLNSPFIKREEQLAKAIIEAEAITGDADDLMVQLSLVGKGKGNVSQADARQYISVICERLEEGLRHEQEKAVARWREELGAEYRLAMIRQQEAKARLGQLRERRSNVLERARQADLSRDSVVDRSREMEHVRRELEMELVGLRARQDKLHETIARLMHTVEERLDNDPALEEMRNIVEMREAELRRREETGTKTGQSGELSHSQNDEQEAERRRRYRDLGQAKGKRVYVDFDEKPFAEVIADFRNRGSGSIVVMWGDLELAGITPDDLVTVKLAGVSPGRALQAVLANVSGGKLDRAVYSVDEEDVITIGPRGLIDAPAAPQDESDILAQREAGMQLVEVRMQLAERMEMVRESAGGGQLSEFNGQLAQLSINTAEMEARLEFVERERERQRELLPLANEFEEIAMELDRMQEEYNQASREASELERERREPQPAEPTVTVLGDPRDGQSHDGATPMPGGLATPDDPNM